MYPVGQSQITIRNNLQILSQNALKKPFAFQIVEEKTGNNPTQHIIKPNSFINELFSRCFGDKDAHLLRLKKVIIDNISTLQQADPSWFLQEQTYTELFLVVQKYNQTISACSSSQTGFLADWKDTLMVAHHRELAPLEISRIVQTELSNILATQKAYVHQEGWFWKHTVYHYNKEDVSISHGAEAAHIFLSTQMERILSLIGKAVEWITRILKHETTFFYQYHYFRDNEDASPERIYRRDPPLQNLDTPTSYWIGHATCLLRLPLTSSSGRTIPVNLITDPVEGDLNKILYPRMTEPARLIDDCPAIHVFLLSHNHLDHYNKATIQKLLAQQPVMIVPKGDGEKFKHLGFKNIREQDWWQSTTVTFKQLGETVNLKITAVPAHHWSGQGLCDGHRSAFLGYVIHGDEQLGDIYFAGDTARLSEAHIQTLKERFQIRTTFQPGGPDEVRKDMKSTHQASVDGLWMHVKLMVKQLYEARHLQLTKEKFIEQAKQLKTIFMHTKTFKLGNLHFDDTDQSVQLVLDALRADPEQLPSILDRMKDYEKQVYEELRALASSIVFNGLPLTPMDIYHILEEGVFIPKIGELSLIGEKPRVDSHQLNRTGHYASAH